MNIVDSWLATFERPTDALKEINEELGSKYNTGNLSQWKHEQKGLLPRTYNYMLKKLVDDPQFKINYSAIRCPDPKSND